MYSVASVSPQYGPQYGKLNEVEWHIYVPAKKVTTGLINSLSLNQRQTIIWTNHLLLLIGNLETKLSEILVKIK